MLKRLINDGAKNPNSQVKATVDLKRGMPIGALAIQEDGSYLTTKAVSDETFKGFADRGDVLTDMVGQGLKEKETSLGQDLIKAGEYFALETINNGELYATTEFEAGMTETEAKGLISVTSTGIFDAGTTGAKFQGQGFRTIDFVKYLAISLA